MRIVNLFCWLILLGGGIATETIVAQQQLDQKRLVRPQQADPPKPEQDPADVARIETIKTEFTDALQQLKLVVRHAETEHLLVFTDLEQEEANKIAELSEKAFVTAARYLRADDIKALFPSKLPIVVLHNSHLFENLQRKIFNTPFTSNSYVLWRIDGDNPCLLVSEIPSSPFRISGFNENWSQHTARWMGTLMLLRKYPADEKNLRQPAWIRNGLGLFASLVAQDDPALIRSYRRLFSERLTSRSRVFDCSSGKRDFHLLHATSLVEYLIAGDPDRFLAVIEACRSEKVVDDDSLNLNIQIELGFKSQTMDPE